MLIINNDDSSPQLLTMDDCIRVQEEAFKKLPDGGAIHRPRIDMYIPCERPDGYFRWGTMEGANDGYFAIRMKSDIITWPTGRERQLDRGEILPRARHLLRHHLPGLDPQRRAARLHQRRRAAAHAGRRRRRHRRQISRRARIRMWSACSARAAWRAPSSRPSPACATSGCARSTARTAQHREDFAEEMTKRLNIEVRAVDDRARGGARRRYPVVLHRQHAAGLRRRVDREGHARHQSRPARDARRGAGQVRRRRCARAPPACR